MVEHVLAAFGAALSLWNLIAISAGVALGIVIGAIPGLGSVTAMSVLIPLTYSMSPLSALAFLVGVNKGGTSGGAVPAILLNSPGTPEAATTALDGHPMAKRGEAKRALKFALFASVTGDTLSDLLLIVLVAPFAAVALQFGPLEYCSVLLCSFALLAGVTGDSPLKGNIAIFLGVFLSTVGLDPVLSSQRMTFGQVPLYGGISLSALAIGALALSPVVDEMIALHRHRGHDAFVVGQHTAGAKTALPVREFLSYWKALLRSSMIGSFVGMLPGLGVSLAALLSYGAARKVSPRRAGFGTGEPEGIIATEAANSAVVGANLVPTIALGIPGNVAAALLIGAFIMHGVIPGPFMLRQNGALIYALFASMILANGIHLLIGRLGTDIWIRFAVIPRGLILPPVVLFCLLGAYLPSQSLWDVGTMLAFTGVGLAMRRLGYPVVCLVIGFLLGGKFEISLRQTLLLYQGRYDDILHSPFALIFLALTLVILLLSFRRSETA